MASYTEHISERLSLSHSVALRLKRGNTGRVLNTETSEEARASVLADSWFAQKLDGFLAHPANDEFCKALSRLQCCSGLLTAFRGRGADKKSGALVLDIEQFGPNPSPGIGRYNSAGESILYLAGSQQGVVAELTHWGAEKITAVEFSIDCGQLRVADLSREDIPPIVAESFDRSERVFNLPGYEKSNLLAETVRLNGFDGMLVPGVRGAPGNHYTNIVIFDPSRWKEWRVSTQSLRLL